MNILAFDTCFAACSAAAAKSFDPGTTGPEGLHGLLEPMETGHAERLVAMIGDVMGAAGLGFAQLDRIAVTHGPGSFTGTRISIAAARALALSFSADIVAVSSLAVMAEGMTRILGSPRCGAPHSGIGPTTGSGIDPGIDPDIGEAPVLIAVDARRGEVYVQLFQTGGANPLTQPLLLPVREAATLGGVGPLIVAGSGAAAVADAAVASGRRVSALLPGLLPDARDLCRLAATMQPGNRAIKPLYLRPADAKPQTGKSIERAIT